MTKKVKEVFLARQFSPYLMLLSFLTDIRWNHSGPVITRRCTEGSGGEPNGMFGNL